MIERQAAEIEALRRENAHLREMLGEAGKAGEGGKAG
jgi:cell shape-determining protein MreC